MKGFFRFLFLVVLLGIIVGGLGYIGWTTLQGGHAGHNMNYSTQKSLQRIPNKSAVQNKDQLTEAMGTLNKAMELITIDPYSKVTVHNGNPQMLSKGTINIFPKDNSTVNIEPSEDGNNQGIPMNQEQGDSNLNFVADQSKLEQIHNGIFKISQGMMLMSELSDSLASQANLMELNPPTADTYVLRYNLALQNKNTLTTALQMLNEAITLVNVNPYASSNGYIYNADKMENLHKGIYQLAQAIVKLNRLNNNFTRQMLEAQEQMASLTSGMGNMSTGSMSHGSMATNNWMPILAPIINIILIILVVGLIVGVFGTLVSLVNGRRQSSEDKSDINSNIREELKENNGKEVR